MNSPLVGKPQYPEPLPLMSETEQAAPYPRHALPDIMREAAEAIAYHVQAPIAIAGQCVIGAAAYLAQPRVNAPHLINPDGMPCSVFMLTLGISSVRKTEVRKLAFRTIDEAEKNARTQHSLESAKIECAASQLTGKKREEYLAANPLPKNPRTQYSDATFEPLAGDMIRGQSVACWDTDEGGQLFGGASLKADTRAATLGGLIRAFDSGHFERCRSRSNLEGSGVAYNRRLIIHVLAQPIAVLEALQDPLLRDQGFLPRFLFADAPSLAGTRLLTAERLSQSAYQDPRLIRYWDRCREIQAKPACIDPDTGEVKPPVLALTDDALSAWVRHYNETETAQSVLGEFSGIQSFAGRAGEIARRVAAVFAYFLGREEIDQDTMDQACELARYSVSEWSRYIEGERVNPEIGKAVALMNWLHDKGWASFDARRLQREGPQSVRKSAKARDRLLSLLVEYRHLMTLDGKSYSINPRATSATSATTQAAPGLGTCDRFATGRDKIAETSICRNSVATLSQPASPYRTGLVADVAAVASTQKPKALPGVKS